MVFLCFLKHQECAAVAVGLESGIFMLSTILYSCFLILLRDILHLVTFILDYCNMLDVRLPLKHVQKLRVCKMWQSGY